MGPDRKMLPIYAALVAETVVGRLQGEQGEAGRPLQAPTPKLDNRPRRPSNSGLSKPNPSLTERRVHMDERTHHMLTSPAAPLLLRMATPNALAFAIQSSVSLAEVWIIGQLGTSALASIALAFPLLMLIQTMSGGAAGGAVTSAIARALGAGDRERAQQLIWHALAVAAAGAGLFFLLFSLFGRPLIAFLGGRGQILEQAVAYCSVIFCGGLFLWLVSVVGAVFRGMGDMKLPAVLMVASAFLQVPLTAVLVLGLFGLPQLGIVGAAFSAVISGFVVSVIMLVVLARDGRVIRLDRHYLSFSKALFRDISKSQCPLRCRPFSPFSSF